MGTDELVEEIVQVKRHELDALSAELAHLLCQWSEAYHKDNINIYLF